MKQIQGICLRRKQKTVHPKEIELRDKLFKLTAQYEGVPMFFIQHLKVTSSSRAMLDLPDGIPGILYTNDFLRARRKRKNER